MAFTASTLRDFLREQGAELVRFLDLSPLPQQAGYPRAILLGMPLTRDFVRAVALQQPVGDEYLQKEAAVEALADRLAQLLTDRGFAARSQSERQNLASGPGEYGYIDPELRCGPSRIPQKTLARLAGLGFVGRNNLLVTKDYGCAIALCSVLTDMPLPGENQAPPAGGCGVCTRCRDACPTGALTGRDWNGHRPQLLDIAKCACPLRCMVVCPYTLHYAGLTAAQIDHVAL